MKAMIWKELRECGTWAVLACAVWCIFNFFGYHTMFSTEDVVRDPLRIWEGKIILNMVLGAFAGGMLGAMQILPELRRDQWAFLLHRPASATTIFAGKAIAGILMLIAIIIISEAFGFYLLRFHLKLEIVSSWYLWVAISIGILAGAVFYFSAMIAALRPAKVFGSRLLSLATAFFILAVLLIIPGYWETLLLVVSSIVVLGLAAHACFQTKGEYRRMATIGRVALGITLLIGGSASGISVITFVKALLPVVFDQSYLNRNYANDYELSDQFMNSNFYTNFVAEQLWGGVSIQLFKNDREVSNIIGRVVFSEPALFRTRYIKSSENEDTLTYYDTVGRRFMFYSLEERRIVGYSGPNGFYAINDIPSHDAAYFSGELLGSPADRFLWFSDAVFRAEKNGRIVKRIIEAESAQPLLNMVPFEVGKEQRLWVLKRSAVEQYDEEGKRLFSVGLTPAESASQYIGGGQFTGRAMVTGTESYVLWFAEIHKKWPGIHVTRSKILVVSQTGEVLERRNLPVLSMDDPPVLSSTMLLTGAALPLLRSDTNVLSKRNWAVVNMVYDIVSKTTIIPASIESVVWTLCLSAVGAWLLARRARLGLVASWLWVALTLLFGAVALIGLVALCAWPVHLACGHCKKLRNIESEECPHCHTPWLRPQHDGTEIISREFQTHALPSGGQE